MFHRALAGGWSSSSTGQLTSATQELLPWPPQLQVGV